jgi:hypothetical protein
MFMPAWFVEGVKRVFPDEGWEVPSDKPGKTVRVVPDNKWESMSGQPEKKAYGTFEGKPLVTADIECTEVEEHAMFLFVNESSKHGHFLDHSGWLEKSDGREYLVSEPYGIDSAALTKMIAWLDTFGWAFNIKGLSGHYPSRTICIEIFPKEWRNVSQ